MISTLLVANRGEIARRIGRTARRLGMRVVQVASEADRFTPAALEADDCIVIGPAAARDSYLNIEAILEAAKASGADAVHPGYGFLSENAGFAEALAEAGIRFVGPRPEHLTGFGLKHTARAIAEASGVPLLPGSGLLESLEEAQAEAARIGFPVMLKSTAGGGGIGMRLCKDAGELAEGYESVLRLARASFGDARVYLERFVSTARHVEVQIFGDGTGGVVALGARDCSLQRRNQKVIEETPAPGLSDAIRATLRDSAIALGREVAYESAGTVEFIYDVARDAVYFLEVNTRLQVEHPVTEEVFGVDLVEWMLRQAAGDFVLPAQDSLVPRGHAIEGRLYAESPAHGFRPSAGRLTEVVFPEGVRVDGWIETGTEVTPWYDPMLAKIIVKAESREAAIAAFGQAVAETKVAGIETNLDYLGAIAASEAFRSGKVTTAVLGAMPFTPRAIDVVVPGTQSSIQDWPGRLGLWDVGVPPSGPFDDRSLRRANRLVGNPEGAPALEMTLTGPTLRFHVPATVALTGADMGATLNGAAVARDAAFVVPAGASLALGRISGAGARAYLAVAGGFDVPDYLGSKSTFALGQFGGHATGVLKAGDVLKLTAEAARPAPQAGTVAPDAVDLGNRYEIGVLYGPHGAPDFFTDKDIRTFFDTDYEVHFNSARTGVRLIGPKPEWARTDGGEAGLHPSNLHDNAYAVGAIDFTGDMPIILGPDGPSLGGFACPAVVVREEFWKVGQLRPGDRVRFIPQMNSEDEVIAKPSLVSGSDTLGPAVLHRSENDLGMVLRRQGDDNLLVEFGPMALDLKTRLAAHQMMEAVRAERLPGLIDLTPGIRSLQIHYDSSVLSRGKLVETLKALDQDLPPVDDMVVPSRVVHLPLSWEDPQAVLAMRKYQELVRPDAPWCPSNIEFIRRINGLDSIADVQKIVFEADYTVFGLGDVYLGAPVATPLDPRHRLVTTKYNPARTWTPENAVGIGGAYMCIYGMEGPGGYQLFGRTIQMWNPWRTTGVFRPGSPWLLRFFDRIRFYPVSAEELLDAREAFPHGRYPVRIEETTLSARQHFDFLAANAGEIATVRAGRRAAFEAEREAWKAAGLEVAASFDDGGPADQGDVPAGQSGIATAVTGNVWKILVEPGATVTPGMPVVIVESMKMEMPVVADAGGVVTEIRCKPGRTVRAGDVVVVVK